MPLILICLSGCGAPAAPEHPAGTERTQVAAAKASQAPKPEPEPVAPTPDSAPTPETDSSPDGSASEDHRFVIRNKESAKDAHGVRVSTLQPNSTEAAVKLVVVDKEKGPVEGIVISLTGADGKERFAKETDAAGYTELLLPIDQKYRLKYLSLGRKDIAASFVITDEPNQSIKLTLRYKRFVPKAGRGFVLQGVNFDTGKATIRPESLKQLDQLVEFMTYKSRSRIRISGHTDNVGDKAQNKQLSQRRAAACKSYLEQHGIAADRIEAVGYGDEQPVDSNQSAMGRAKNRRIEATEL